MTMTYNVIIAVSRFFINKIKTIMLINFIYLFQLIYSITEKMSTLDLSLFKKFNPEEYCLESNPDESSDPLLPVEKKKLQC